MRAQFRCVIALSALAVLVGQGSADAETLTVGPPLSSSTESAGLGTHPITLVNASLADPAADVVSPVDGTVVGWRLSTATGSWRLRVLQRILRYGYFGAGRSAESGPVPSGVTPPYPTHLPIRAGDYIGLDNVTPYNEVGLVAHSGAMNPFVFPVPEGGTAQTAATNPYDFAFNATIRFCRVPDLTGLTRARAGQVLEAADCKLGRVKRGKGRQGNGKGRKSRVVAQGEAPGLAVSDNAPIGLTLARRPAARSLQRPAGG